MAHSQDIELGNECPMSLSRLTELAKGDQARRFYSIAHFLTPRALYEAVKGLRKNASAGVDGVTFQDYQKELGRTLQNLHERVKSGQYRAQPLRRDYIPKENGSQRGISIPAMEDKILQAATARILNAIYGAPGKSWRFQRVKIPHRQGDSHPTKNRALGLWR